MAISIYNLKKNHLKTTFYAVFLILYFLVLLYLSEKVYIWEDESYSLNTSSHNISEVIKLSYNFEGQPPFYFVLLSIWRLINSSIFFARLLSVICIGFSAFFIHRLVSLIIGKDAIGWIVIVFLLNPFTVWAALEIRLYAFVILLSIMSTYYFFLFYIENKSKYLYIFLIISLVALYTQYFFSLLIFSLALALWIFKGYKVFLKFCLSLIPIFFLFLPNFIFIIDQVSMAQTHLSGNIFSNTILSVLRTPQNFMLSLETVPIDRIGRWIIKIAFLIVVVFAFVKLFRRKSIVTNSKKDLFKAILLVISILFLLYLILIPSLQLIYQDKYMIIVFPLLMLFFSIFLVFSSLKRNFVFGIISIYFISLLIWKYSYPEKTYDFKAVANFINNIQLEKEPILFYDKSILPPFEYYYKGDEQLFALPPLKYDKNYYEERIKDTSELGKEIQSINFSTNSCLFITGSIEGFKYDPLMNRKIIEQFLKNHYIISLDSSFKSKNSNNTLRVQRLNKK